MIRTQKSPWLLTRSTALTLIILLTGFATSATAGKHPAYLDAVAHFNPVFAQWLDREQTKNDRVENLEVFTSINHSNALPPAYLPENRPDISLTTYEIPLADVDVMNTREEALADLLVERNGIKYVRFFVHPVSLSLFSERLKSYNQVSGYRATPFASFRSLMVWNEDPSVKPFLIKVSLNATIGELVRNLRTTTDLKRQVAVSKYIGSISGIKLARQGIRIVDEPLAIAPHNFAYGMSTRSWPQIADGEEIWPYFSLFARRGQKKAKIVELIRAGQLPAREFLRRFILEPLIRQNAFLVLEYGLIGEHHEQNIMAVVRNSRLSGENFYRDFGGFFIDPRYIVAQGHPLPSQEIIWATKPEHWVNFIGQTETYLRDSTLFAMVEAVKQEYPDVTKEWIDTEFAEQMRVQFENFFGRTYQTYASSKIGLASYLKNGMRSLKPCQRLALQRFQN